MNLQQALERIEVLEKALDQSKQSYKNLKQRCRTENDERILGRYWREKERAEKLKKENERLRKMIGE